MRLNLACGANIFPGWINMDLVDMEEAYLRHLRGCASFVGWPEEQRVLAEALKRGEVEFRQHDILTGIPFADESVDAIYLGQMIEHLNPIHEAPQFLRECRRVLKPAGRIRITTPDLDQLIEFRRSGKLHTLESEQPKEYSNACDDAKLAYMLYGALGAGCTRSNYEGHFMCYTHVSMHELARSAGLRYATMLLDRNPTEAFRGVIDKGLSHSMAVELEKDGSP